MESLLKLLAAHSCFLLAGSHSQMDCFRLCVDTDAEQVALDGYLPVRPIAQWSFTDLF